MTSRPATRIPVLLVITLAALCAGGQVAPAAPEAVAGSPGVVYRVDFASLEATEIAELLAWPQTRGWIEFGDVAVLLGGSDLASRARARFPELSVQGFARDGRSLWSLRAPDAGPPPGAAADGLHVLVGRGRQAVVLASPAAAEAFAARTGAELHSLDADGPPRLALVQRLDRWSAPAAASAGSTPLLTAAVQAVDVERYHTEVAGLTGFATRYTPNAAFPDVTDHVADAFSALGYAVTLDPFQLGGNTRHNVVAEIPGELTPDDVYIVCGHYDCTSQSPNSVAPGADDNASGAAGVLELARVLGQYRFDSTVRFVAFAGEEQGLVGSATYVDDLIAAGELGDVRGVINMDMIGYLNNGDWDVLLEGKAGVSAGLLGLLPGLVSEHTSLTGYVSTNPYGSDHMPFINNGVNAVLTIEYEDWFNPNYHKTSDRLGTLTLPFAAEILKLNAAAIATMAGIRGGYMLAYGEGLAGAGGFVPELRGSGSANLGEPFRLELRDGLGGAAALFLAGVEAGSLPKYGGTIWVGPIGALLIAPLTLGGPAQAGAGSLLIDTSVPGDVALVGQSVHVQYVLADPAAPFGRSLSNGLQLLFGQ